MSNQPLPDQMTDEPYFGDVPTSERQWGMFAHLSALVAVWLGGMAFLGPLVVWLIKKDEMRFVDDQGKESLNFQLNILLFGMALGIIAVPLVFLTLGFGALLLIPLGIGLAAFAIIMPIIATIQVNAGTTYRYPFIIRLVK